MDAAAALGLPPETLEAVFPFHVAFDRELRVIQRGRAFAKLWPQLERGSGLAAMAEIVTPAGMAWDFDAIAGQAFTVFFLRLTRGERQVVLRGQMLHREQDGAEAILFLCSPVFHDTGQIAELGLSLNDFAVHDAAVDFLILLQTKDNTIDDVRRMADRLRAEVSSRRKAEQSLQEANEALEGRVAQRTRELSEANLELQRTVAKLKAKNRQITLLNRFGDMLQACRSEQETFSVLHDAARDLFPTDSGVLALLTPDGAATVASSWNDPQLRSECLAPRSCLALAKGRSQVVSRDTAGACETLREGDRGHLCMPLVAHGERLGALHLQCDTHPPRRGHDSGFESVAERRDLLHSFAEQVGLAVSNLRLQESLRAQSIRDPLTGLYNRRHMEEALARELERAHRHRLSVAVIMTDVDHFKRFNDSYGHQAGDALLRGLGEFMAGRVRAEDVACRYGGEEFLFILPGADREQALRRAEGIRSAVEDKLAIPFHGKPLPPVTISLGVAVAPRCGDDGDALIAAADAALYRAKQGGRNRVELAPDQPSPSR